MTVKASAAGATASEPGGVGNYVFERTLGQGNFAVVKLARHVRTGMQVHCA